MSNQISFSEALAKEVAEDLTPIVTDLFGEHFCTWGSDIDNHGEITSQVKKIAGPEYPDETGTYQKFDIMWERYDEAIENRKDQFEEAFRKFLQDFIREGLTI